MFEFTILERRFFQPFSPCYHLSFKTQSEVIAQSKSPFLRSFAPVMARRSGRPPSLRRRPALPDVKPFYRKATRILLL